MKLADFAAMTISQASEIGAGARGDAITAQTTGSAAAQRQHQRLVVALDRGTQIHRLAAGRHGTIGQVLARAEAAPRAGEQQHAGGRRCFRLHPAKRIANLRVHRVVEAVEAIGTVERQSRDAAFDREEDAVVGHHT
jgi:hypothetical protein